MTTLELFELLADTWERETWHMTNSSVALRHPSFAAIIDLGGAAVPLMRERARERGSHWTYVVSVMDE